MRRSILGVALVQLVGCKVVEESDSSWFSPATAANGVDEEPRQLDDRAVERAGVVPPPISGGTLLVLADGTTVIAADPDRDLVHVADLATARATASIALMPGDEPGRSIEDDAGMVHVVLRGAAELASIDPRRGVVIVRQPTCANPRGIAFDPGAGVVRVACAGGELVAHTPGGPIVARVRVAPDLRDVLVVDGLVRASRFRSAELLNVDPSGSILSRRSPPHTDDGRVPAIAWRTTVMPDGGWLMVHQSASAEPIALDPSDRSPYGSGTTGCDGLVAAVVTVGHAAGDIVTSGPITHATLAVDAAISPDATRIAMAIAGQHDDGSPTMTRQRGLALLRASDLAVAPADACTDPDDVPLPGHAVAVAFRDDDTVVVQSREPAALFVVDVDDHDVTTIALAGDARADTGHDLFHQDAGVGLSCASCHPEGGDDGRVWDFTALGERRTQSLRSGLADTEPFHWGGDVEDFAALVEEVHGRRMGAAIQIDDRVAAFADWVLAIRPSNPERSADDELAQSGEGAFTRLGCAGCHNDAALAAGRADDIDGAELQVPPLRGVALRPPYMHDGRADTLTEAVEQMIVATAQDATTDDIDAITAYLERL